MDALFSYNCEHEAVKDEDTKDLSEYLEVETKEDSDDETPGDEPLICKICFAQFKTKSGWKNHKVIHQKFRTKEFACYICFRRFYWDKDCRRHVKNIHGIDNYDSEESRHRLIHFQILVRGGKYEWGTISTPKSANFFPIFFNFSPKFANFCNFPQNNANLNNFSPTK